MIRASRDPRRRFELRRLAYQAKRSAGAREVLHDALLETFPRDYEWWIEKAHERVGYTRGEDLVYFMPDRMAPRALSLGQSPLFLLVPNQFQDKKISTSRLEKEYQNFRVSHWKTAVIVYRTRGFL